MNRRISISLAWLIVLVLFAVAGLLLRHDINVFQETSSRGPIGKQAPDGTVLALDGHSTRLAAYHGRALWLNFFATWCRPCRAEMPAIEIEYRRFHRDGLEVLGVDQQEDRARVAAFVKPFGLSFPLAIDQGALAQTYGVIAIPTSVFIDRSGIVRAVHIGAMDPAQMEADLKKIM